MKTVQQKTVRVQGKGNSKQSAFVSALSNIQREILKNNHNILLRIEPIDVQVISSEEKISKETFLFFFFPRKKSQFSVVLDIFVEISFVEIEKIHFQIQK